MQEIVVPEAIVQRVEPVVVSMETIPDPRQRHIDFHNKIAQPAAATAAPTAQWLSSPGELRRAFIVHTILGPPKGLE